MIDADKAIKKLRKPPGVHNWVRNIRRRTDDFALSLYDTAVNAPRHSLKQVSDIIRNVVVDGIADEMALESVNRISNARTRAYGFQILRALLPYIRKNSWKGVQVFKGLVEYYRVAANVDVPIRPTFVINDNGQLVPFFVICWVQVGLSDYHKRILSTLIKDSILSLEEFEGSDAVIVCVPRHSFSKTERYVVEWKISDHMPLSREEKSELFDRYGSALELAERMIVENLG